MHNKYFLTINYYDVDLFLPIVFYCNNTVEKNDIITAR